MKGSIVAKFGGSSLADGQQLSILLKIDPPVRSLDTAVPIL